MRTKRKLIPALAGLILIASACTEQSESGGDLGGNGLSKVLLLGDSVAAGQAVPMRHAFAAGDVPFESLASEGGGNVVGPFSEEQWEELPDQIASAEPEVVVYQITTYDWGGEDEQRSGYERLLETVADSGAELVFVTAPPIEPDEFYEPHMDELERAPEVAAEVAESSDEAHLLDASEVWGEEYRADRDGVPDRSEDGIHTCPQGAARFTDWLLGELSGLYPEFEPAPAEDWADDGWSGDEHFVGC
ncbi:SGNH/GDSL hydrolase family protein [Glycomyces salinus]|uniref:SGNH/GDSL hydrolase family protein n=1 Tax=Glycomyces salinus TaxID=980294 RepID=UPI0018EBB9B7|nr:SGNH/GDSL hydrolase family protein [Glycomyces salinus]